MCPGSVVTHERLAAQHPAHDGGEFLHLCVGGCRYAEGPVRHGSAPADSEGEPAAGQAPHGGDEGRIDLGVTNVVVGDPGVDVDPLGHRAGSAADRRGLLGSPAFGDPGMADTQLLGLAVLGDQIAGLI